MELRKVEQELDTLSAEWKAVRRQRVSGSDTGDSLSSRLLPWSELKAQVQEDALFPPAAEEEEDATAEGRRTVPVISTQKKEDPAAEEAGGCSDFGMCLALSWKTAAVTSSTTASVWERYAAKSAPTPKSVAPTATAKSASQVAVDEERGQEEIIVEEASAKEILERLEALKEKCVALQPKIEKYKAKVNDRDPVTKKPRYGAKTLLRVKEAVRNFAALELGVDSASHGTDASPSVVDALQHQRQRDVARRDAQLTAQVSHEQLEAEQRAREKLLAEEQAARQQQAGEERKRNEERELARLAEEARQQRVAEEQRAADAERRADRELLALVPTRSAAGVREQLGRLRVALREDKTALDVALGSLYTLFEQIVRKPEEGNFRRVRRDHPQFVADIGRHAGGREVLLAAGFTLAKLDGVPCFLSKEPHLESDMDGWAAWFDALKQTLAVVEEEMLK